MHFANLHRKNVQRSKMFPQGLRKIVILEMGDTH